MRKILLATTAAALALSTAAPGFAADMKADMETKSQVQTNEMGTSPDAKSADKAPMTNTDVYRSFNMTSEFEGTIAGGYSAEDLIGVDVQDANGETVGEIADLLIDGNENADRVLVDVGGFLGIGEKRVALPISDLTQKGDVLVSSRTEAQLEAMPSYKASEGSWLRELVK